MSTRSKPDDKPVIEGESLESFSKSIFEGVLNAVRHSNKLPVDEDYHYYANFKPFKKKMAELGDELLTLSQQMLHQAQPGSASLPPSTEATVDEISDRFDLLSSHIVDNLLESVDTYVDTCEGHRVRKQPLNFIEPPRFQPASATVSRPQLHFDDKINNYGPWIPKIFEKPNAIVPLDEVFCRSPNAANPPAEDLSADMRSHMTSLGLDDGNTSGVSYPHPYEHELRNIEYMPWQLKTNVEIVPLPMEQTAYHYIDTPNGLNNLCEVLDKSLMFAIDLEHHNYRSYEGFVCLMQISTRTEDYVVDTLKLRSHIYTLNSSFTNPRILKVLHGSDMDILWLQRDFGVYVVNSFDTGQACSVLEFPHKSLKYLLEKHCNITADKKFQLADWRIRPLPDEMVLYARSDTHYLLFIYDQLKNELILRGNENNNLLLSVLNRSRDVALHRYVREPFDPNGFHQLYNRIANVKFSHLQIHVLEKLYAWRDATARAVDESPRYVMPNAMMLNLARGMPPDVPALIALCAPVPQYVRVHAADLVTLIMAACAEALPAPLDSPRKPDLSTLKPSHIRFGDAAPAAYSPISRVPGPGYTPSLGSSPSSPPSSSPSSSTSSNDSPPGANSAAALAAASANSNANANANANTIVGGAGAFAPDARPRGFAMPQLSGAAAPGAGLGLGLGRQPASGGPGAFGSPGAGAGAGAAPIAMAPPRNVGGESVLGDDSLFRGEASSPVLSTEQLYKTAGWEMGAHDGQGPRSVNTPIVPPDVACLSFSDVDDDDLDSDDEECRKTAQLIAASMTSPFAPLSFEPSIESKAQQAPTTVAPPTVGVSKSVTDLQVAIPATGEVGGQDLNSPAAVGESVEKVPRSMAEIYKLSNKNRKRNKEKKRLKEDSIRQPCSPLQLPRESSLDDAFAAHVTATGNEGKVEFMRRIGWLAPGAVPPPGGVSFRDGCGDGGGGGGGAGTDPASLSYGEQLQLHQHRRELSAVRGGRGGDGGMRRSSVGPGPLPLPGGAVPGVPGGLGGLARGRGEHRHSSLPGGNAASIGPSGDAGGGGFAYDFGDPQQPFGAANSSHVAAQQQNFFGFQLSEPQFGHSSHSRTRHPAGGQTSQTFRGGRVRGHRLFCE